MPIVRDLIQTVVIGKTPCHQPASLQVHGDIAMIMASMDVIDVMRQQFLAAAGNDLMRGSLPARSARSRNKKAPQRLC